MVYFIPFFVLVAIGLVVLLNSLAKKSIYRWADENNYKIKQVKRRFFHYPFFWVMAGGMAGAEGTAMNDKFNYRNF